jgi:hypothetical protein
MGVALYKPIYHTFLAVFVTLVLGIFTWMIGSLIGLPSFFDSDYRVYPSGLLIAFMAMIVAGVAVFVASFTVSKWYGLLALLVATILAFIVLVLLQWVIETWDTTTILVMALMLMAIAIGLIFNMFGKTAPIIGAWFGGSLIVTFLVMDWILTKWGTSFLYYLIVVVVVLLYVVVFLSYVLIPKRMLEG